MGALLPLPFPHLYSSLQQHHCDLVFFFLPRPAGRMDGSTLRIRRADALLVVLLLVLLAALVTTRSGPGTRDCRPNASTERIRAVPNLRLDGNKYFSAVLKRPLPPLSVCVLFSQILSCVSSHQSLLRKHVTLP